jgi:hypothetical protein
MNLTEVIAELEARLPDPQRVEEILVNQMREQYLSCHDPLGDCIERAPDFAHSAPTQQFPQSIPPEWRAGHVLRPAQSTPCSFARRK